MEMDSRSSFGRDNLRHGHLTITAQGGTATRSRKPREAARPELVDVPPPLPVTALREIGHWHSCLTVMSNQKHRIDGAFTSRCYQRGSLETPRSLKYLLRGANSCSR